MGAPWYTFPRVDNLGVPDSFGGFPKPDSNIQLPANYPITALLGGTVTGIDRVSAWGTSITIALDKPLNALASHTAYLHLAGIASGLGIGSHVQAGQLIGYNGGSNASGSQKVPLGFALYSGNNYGMDSGWSNETFANVTGPLSPVSLLNSVSGGSVSSPCDALPEPLKTQCVNAFLGAGVAAGSATATVGPDPLGIGGINSFFGSLNNANWKDIGIRTGLITAGAVVVILGVYLFLKG